MGRAEDALAWLRQAVRLGQHDARLYSASPLLQPLRRGPGLGEVLDAIAESAAARPAQP
jgi:hypothetical protein